MPEIYPPSRSYSPTKTFEDLGFNIPQLATRLGIEAHEPPRLGDLGCGEGITAKHLLDLRFKITGLDPRPILHLPPNAQIIGKYPEARFPQSPHLIYAHHSVAAFSPQHSFFPYYADFTPTVLQIMKDLHSTGTAIITGYWDRNRDLRPTLSYAQQQGFTLLTTPPKNSDSLHLILTKTPQILASCSSQPLLNLDPNTPD